jgi:hypothetical protein
MSTSGDTSWVLTRDDIINAALRKIGALADGQTASSTQLTNANLALNSLLRVLQTDGMPLWKRTEVPITLVNGTANYTVTNAIKIPAVYLLTSGTTTRYPMVEKSRYDFLALPNSSGSLPVHWSATPTLTDYTINIWPTPDSTSATTYSLTVVAQKKFDDFVSATDNPDFPAYWMDAMIYGLAVRLAPEYGLPLMDRQQLLREFEMYKESAQGYGDEDGSIYVQPEKRWK